MTEEFDEKISIEQAEGTVWPDPPADATRVVKAVHALRKKPLSALRPEDLRVLLTQQVGLDLTIPRALDLLEKNPLVEGDFYAGDVLSTILRVDKDYWLTHYNSAERLRNVVRNFEQLDDLDVFFPDDDDIWKSISGLRDADLLK